MARKLGNINDRGKECEEGKVENRIGEDRGG